MGFKDDLEMRLSQSAANAVNNIDGFLGQNSDDADPQIVVSDTAPAGNVSALDIFNGVFGGPPAPAAPKAAAATTQNASPRPPMPATPWPMWLLPVAAAGALYFFTRGKGG